MRIGFAHMVAAVAGIVAFAADGRAGLFAPETLTFLAEPKTQACGIRADYDLSGSMLRVEILIARADSGYTVMARAYKPNSVAPPMRDIWLKTKSVFSLGLFRPAVENGNGILESRGELGVDNGKVFASELAQGQVEISIIFDGVMPTARLPVGLPTPLPVGVAGELESCLGLV